MGFLVMIPASIFSFQALWWLLHPFALVFEDKLEIKQSLLHHKLRYFVDVKRISESKSGKLYITYNDDEMEALNLFGIKPSHVALLRDELKTRRRKHENTAINRRFCNLFFLTSLFIINKALFKIIQCPGFICSIKN